MDLAAYRRSAETFVSDLEGEFQRHYTELTGDPLDFGVLVADLGL